MNAVFVLAKGAVQQSIANLDRQVRVSAWLRKQRIAAFNIPCAKRAARK